MKKADAYPWTTLGSVRCFPACSHGGYGDPPEQMGAITAALQDFKTALQDPANLVQPHTLLTNRLNTVRCAALESAEDRRACEQWALRQ